MKILLIWLSGAVGGLVAYVLAVSSLVDFVCGPCQRLAVFANDRGHPRLAARVMLVGVTLLAWVHGGADTPAHRLQRRYRALSRGEPPPC